MSELAKLIEKNRNSEVVPISLKVNQDDLKNFDNFCKKHGENRSSMLNIFIANVEAIYGAKSLDDKEEGGEKNSKI